MSGPGSIFAMGEITDLRSSGTAVPRAPAFVYKIREIQPVSVRLDDTILRTILAVLR